MNNPARKAVFISKDPRVATGQVTMLEAVALRQMQEDQLDLAVREQYLDVGTTVQAQLREFKGSTSLEARVEITNFATPDQATKGGQPLLRQMIISGSTLVISDKPVIIGSGDDPNSKRQFQLEVTVTKLR